MPVILRKISRQIHLWGALIIFIPVVIVIGSGLLLQVKKELEWVQPPTQKTSVSVPSIPFDGILESAINVTELEASSWDDIDRLDVRPGKGVIKILAKNGWEAQINPENGDVLQVAYRRSDTIEAIHDGSWFFDGAKLWLFLPVAIVLFFLWVTGLVMLYTTLKSKYLKRHHRQLRTSDNNN